MTNKKELKSKCCGADVYLGGGGDFSADDEICTRYYVCKKCGEVCDLESGYDMFFAGENKPSTWIVVVSWIFLLISIFLFLLLTL